MKRRVLFITYYFPPDASPGSARMSAHVRSLHRKGWDISVLCSTGLAVGRTDPGRLEGLPGSLEVHRTPAVDLYGRFQRSAGPAGGGTDAQPKRVRGGLKRKLIRPLKWLLYPFYQLSRWPDKQVGWVLPLIRNGYRIIRRENVDLVFSSSPPHSSQLGVLVLRKLLGFKWITDWRDPWSAPFRHPRTKLSKRLQRQLEKVVLRNCDRIIVNTPGNRESLLDSFPGIPEDKVAVVTNGFDTEQRVDDGLETPDAVDCDIVYVGEVYQGMLELLLDALVRLRDRDPEAVPHIHIFGTIHQTEWDKITARGLDTYIHYRGFVSWSQSVRVMREAKALLLLLSNTPESVSWVPSKVYPYVFSGTPILAMVPDGDAAAILRGSGMGVVVTTPDVDRISSEIERFVGELRSGALDLKPDESFLEQYSIATLSSRVDRLMGETLET